MSEAIRPHLVIVSYWLVMVLAAAFFLRLACSLCRTGMPTWRRAIISTIVVTFLAYLAFDFMSYIIMRGMEEMQVLIPPWYGYNYWFRESIALKWYIISQAGAVRFLPFVVAIVVGSFLEFVVLQAQVTFGVGLLIVILQWGATVATGYILSLVYGVVLAGIGWTLQPTSVAKAPSHNAARAEAKHGKTVTAKKSTSHAKSGKSHSGHDAKSASATQPRQDAKTAEGKPPTQADSQDSEPQTLEIIEHHIDAAAQDPREFLSHTGENLKAYANSHLEELQEELEPVTQRLPEPVRNFLAQGGWWVVIGVTGFIALLWLRAILRRLGGAFRRPKRRRKKSRKTATPSITREKLAWITGGLTERGPQQFTVKGIPARLRLVILSPGTRDVSDLSEDMADRVLDWIKPGMAQVASYDQPGIRVWPPFYSTDGFAIALATNVPIPEAKGMKSRWILASGRIQIGRVLINVGLALYADLPNSFRLMKVKGDRWLSVLNVEKTREEAAMR
jgi:hypothetical protein